MLVRKRAYRQDYLLPKGSSQHMRGLVQGFTSVDPLANESPHLNPFHYSSNNPINRVDPSGMKDGPAGEAPKAGGGKADNLSGGNDMGSKTLIVGDSPYQVDSGAVFSADGKEVTGADGKGFTWDSEAGAYIRDDAMDMASKNPIEASEISTENSFGNEFVKGLSRATGSLGRSASQVPEGMRQLDLGHKFKVLIGWDSPNNEDEMAGSAMTRFIVSAAFTAGGGGGVNIASLLFDANNAVSEVYNGMEQTDINIGRDFVESNLGSTGTLLYDAGEIGTGLGAAGSSLRNASLNAGQGSTQVEQVYNISKDLLPFMWSGGSAGNTAIERAKR